MDTLIKVAEDVLGMQHQKQRLKGFAKRFFPIATGNKIKLSSRLSKIKSNTKCKRRSCYNSVNGTNAIPLCSDHLKNKCGVPECLRQIDKCYKGDKCKNHRSARGRTCCSCDAAGHGHDGACTHASKGPTFKGMCKTCFDQSC